MSTLKLAVIPDFREEGWHSMDLVADMLSREIAAGRAGDVVSTSLCPPFRKRFARLPVFGKRNAAINADRLSNRMIDYPRALRQQRDFDCYHVCDHSYSQVVHALPANRTGVFCHDLDTFRCLFEPEKEPRPRWFKAMTRRILTGMQQVAIVFHTTSEIRRQILEHGIIDPARLVQVPLGVSSTYSPLDPGTDGDNAVLKSLGGRPYVLHVGSCISRKRIDVLLRVFAGLRARVPELRFVKVGGPLTAEQSDLFDELKLESSTILLERQSETELAALYRHASAVLQPSEAEGFGLPVIEALACGAPVVASAIPTLMEVGGDAAMFCPVGAVDLWVSTVASVISDTSFAPSIETRLKQAATYSWTKYARTICDAYAGLAGLRDRPNSGLPVQL
ncbi:MAG: glycosyltransferase family 1 protein [Planctomycetota bacterium]